MKKLFYFLAIIIHGIINAQVGIKTDNPQATLDVNGNLIIKDTKEIKLNGQPLYIDSNGLVGVKDQSYIGVDDQVFYAETTRSLRYDHLDFNNGKTIELEFESQDIQHNLLDVQISGKYFKIEKPGVYKVDASINYFMAANDNNKLFVRNTVEVSNDNGQTWDIITGARPVFIVTWPNGQYFPTAIPTAVVSLKKGALIRLSLLRTRDTNNNVQGNSISKISLSSNYGTKSYQLTLQKL